MSAVARASRRLSFALAGALLAGSSAARAQDPPALVPHAPPPSPPPGAYVPSPVPVGVADPLKPLGIGLTATAGAMFATGVITYAIGAHGYEVCGITGCFRRLDRGALVTGAAFFGGAAGMSAFALPVLAYGMQNDGTIPRKRRSEGVLRTGIAFTALGAGLIVAAMGAKFRAADLAPIAYDIDFPFTLMVVTGGAMMLSGIPLWITGAAQRKAGDEPPGALRGAPPPPDPDARYSKPMMITGITLASLGGVAAASGGIVLGNGDGDFGAGFIGALLLGAGGLFVVVGVPLAIVGSLRPSAPSARSPLEPYVNVGLGSAMLEWRY